MGSDAVWVYVVTGKFRVFQYVLCCCLELVSLVCLFVSLLFMSR